MIIHGRFICKSPRLETAKYPSNDGEANCFISILQTTIVDLRKKVILLAKMGLFGNGRGIAILDKQATAKVISKSNKQRRGTLFYRVKGGN